MFLRLVDVEFSRGPSKQSKYDVAVRLGSSRFTLNVSSTRNDDAYTSRPTSRGCSFALFITNRKA